jgi:hypothetical protein
MRHHGAIPDKIAHVPDERRLEAESRCQEVHFDSVGVHDGRPKPFHCASQLVPIERRVDGAAAQTPQKRADGAALYGAQGAVADGGEASAQWQKHHPDAHRPGFGQELSIAARHESELGTCRRRVRLDRGHQVEQAPFGSAKVSGGVQKEDPHREGRRSQRLASLNPFLISCDGPLALG